jgi:hypothetical protein
MYKLFGVHSIVLSLPSRLLAVTMMIEFAALPPISCGV